MLLSSEDTMVVPMLSFPKALNPNLIAMAIEGSYASVIGGAPAAAVVSREVNERVKQDARITIYKIR